MADHLAVGRLAGGQLALAVRELRAAELEPRFGLGDVGSGEVADLEAVAGRLEIGLEDLHVVLVQLDDRAVADHVHVGRHRIGEDIAFDRGQRRAARFDTGLGRAHVIADASAVEQRVADIEPRRDRRALPPVSRIPLRLKSWLRPTVPLTCGRPAALAIATLASVAFKVSRCAVRVGFV